MITVKVSTSFPEWPILRQTPKSKGIWGDCRFIINQEIEQCDYWFIYEGVLGKETVICPKGNVILITGEPSSVKKYSKGYLKQFSKVITCQKYIKHNGPIFYQQCLPWMVGRRVKGDQNISFSKDYDELKSTGIISKGNLMSVISSNKVFTEGHQKRIDFVMKLKKYYGEKVDVFGRGICDIEDKWDAIYKYKYHIVIENSSLDDYWTEKLSDAYLGGAFPFYYGCTNLERYFPKGAFKYINIADFDKSVKTIDECINQGLYENSVEQLEMAKSLILDKYNLFAFINDFCREDHYSVRKSIELVTVKPEENYNKIDMIKKSLKRLVK